jgi:hypothetical protein
MCMRLCSEMYRNARITETDGERRDRILAETTFHDMLTLFAIFRCHNKDLLVPYWLCRRGILVYLRSVCHSTFRFLEFSLQCTKIFNWNLVNELSQWISKFEFHYAWPTFDWIIPFGVHIYFSDLFFPGWSEESEIVDLTSGFLLNSNRSSSSFGTFHPSSTES